MLRYTIITTNEEYDAARLLFKEYAAAITIDLSFQHFNEELEDLKEMYAKKDGGIILCSEAGEYIGCVALRRFSGPGAELKRMYVKPGHQGKGIGRELLKRAIELARSLKYETIFLDTLNSMKSAISLYKNAGFQETQPYYHNPINTSLFFKLTL